MKILFIGSEATPFVKTGGLADVLGSLPKAMEKRGHEIALILPKHKAIKEKYQEKLILEHTTKVPIAKKKEFVGIESMRHEGMTIYFIDNEYYFGYRPNLYGDYDDGERYGYFSHAVIALIKHLNYDVDILHLHDWQTGLIPYIMKVSKEKRLRHIHTVFTIHNIAYQGIFDKQLMPYLSVPFSEEIEYDGMINFLKSGIVTADYVTTVSPAYAEEIQYAYFGYGMEGILKDRKDTLKGIMNGINYEDFNPKTDPLIHKNYHLHNYLKGKEANKQALMKMFHLENETLPVFGIVSRLTEQKGFTLLKGIIELLLKAKKLQLIVLGSGDKDLQHYFESLRRAYPELVGLYFGYSEKIARNIYAGADFFLMPSRFEPCGLSQLIALKYGTLPVVRQTGGLKDSVEPYNKFTNSGTGLGFLNFSSEDLARTLDAALALFNNKRNFNQVRRRGMQEDFSWEASAKIYEELYQSLGGE